MYIDKLAGKRAVLYARKSTESEDRQVQSIDDQIRKMKDIAKIEGLKVVEILEESKSAKAPGVRPVFGQMMENIENKKYDIILVWDTSRLSRNPKDGGDLQWLLNNGDLAGIRTHEKWYYDSDDLILSIENSMNGQFIKELKAKVKRGMDSKVDKGDYGSHAPIGYLNDKLNKIIIPDPIMFDRVATLWQKALTGIYSVPELTKIARNELMIRSPQTKRRGGNPLCENAVRNLLKNPFYTGQFKWKGQIYNGNHPPMISKAEFEKMQTLINPKHSTRPKSEESYDFLLRGMLTCAECGHAIVTVKKFKRLKDGTKKEYHYCYCGGKNREVKCKNRSICIREEILVQQIKDELSRYTIDDDFYKIALEALAEEDEMEVSRQAEKLTNINKVIADKNNELNALRRSLYTGLITDNAFFLSEQELLTNEITKLEKDRSKVLDISNDWREKANDVFMFARYAKEDFDSDDWERKRAVIKRLGVNLKLSGGTIQFTPVKYLILIAEKYPELKAQFEAGGTDILQIKNNPREAVSSLWSG